MPRSTTAHARSTTKPQRPGPAGSQSQGSRAGRLAATDWAAPDTTLFRDCIDACNRTLAYCLRQGGKHAEYEHIAGILDCLEVCITTADLAGRNSPVAPALIQVCGEVAKDCEESCEAFGDDAEMVRCADACRDLAEWCLLQASAPQA